MDTIRLTPAPPPRMVDYALLQFLGEHSPLNTLKEYLTDEGKAMLHSLNFDEALKLAKWWKKIEAKYGCDCVCHRDE